MPLRVLRLRLLMGTSVVRGLLVTGMFSAFFLGSLYLERVLGYNAIQTGLAFLPLTLSIAIMSIGLSARLVERFGAVGRAAGGPRGDRRGAAAAGAGRLARGYFPGLFFAFLLLGLGAGASFLPLLTIGMADAPAARRGARVGHHQRLGAAVRRDRPGGARHGRDRPHANADRAAATRWRRR